MHAIEVAKEGMAGTEHLYDAQEEKAATKLEAMVRGKKARQKVDKMKDERNQDRAAVKLEAVARGKRDRKKVEKMREKKRKEKAAARKKKEEEKEGDEDTSAADVDDV